MSRNTRNAARDFWYEFDDQTLWNRTPAMSDAMARAYFHHGLTFDSVMEALRVSFSQSDHPLSFRGIVEVGKAGFLDLAALQWRIVSAHLAEGDAVRTAFEDFGQGVLYDDRPPRPPGRLIHMMDGTPDDWVGYHRWHAFVRATSLFAEDAERWLQFNRCIGLAWAIQTKADPVVDKPSNPGLPPRQLEDLRQVWMSLSQLQLDWAFVNHRFRAPSIDALRATGIDVPQERARAGGYARIQMLLGEAAGNLLPIHDGQGRFWESSYAEFMSLPPIYGVQLIATPGPNRGSRSGLVRVLKGEEPGIPQMPLNRPPMQRQHIQEIESWIDADCPET